MLPEQEAVRFVVVRETLPDQAFAAFNVPDDVITNSGCGKSAKHAGTTRPTSRPAALSAPPPLSPPFRESVHARACVRVRGVHQFNVVKVMRWMSGCALVR